jgi:hypothetical protein
VRCATRKVVKGPRPADEVGGPRTQQCGDAKHSVKAPSAWRRWELQADKTVACGTQAYALRSQPLPQGSLAVCCSTSTRCHVPERHVMPRAHPRGAAGAVKRPVVPHAPLGEMRSRKTGEPQAGRRTGAISRVWSSASSLRGAQRRSNPAQLCRICRLDCFGSLAMTRVCRSAIQNTPRAEFS